MMNDKELRLEAMKLAAGLISPSVNDRAEELCHVAERLYNFIICGNVAPEGTDTPKRGRPPRPRPEVI